MINFDSCDSRLLDEVDLVIEDLRKNIDIEPDTALLVGAACRNILHSALGHAFPGRNTLDLDLGLALPDWELFTQVERAFPRHGHTGICFKIAGIRVDVMPFGAIEVPDGVVTPSAHGEEFSVFGFGDVYARSASLPLPSGAVIRIPQPAGYALLKMRAWIDRSVYGQDKDGQDLATAMYWYQESSHIHDRLWAPGREAMMESLEWDVSLASVHMLGHDIQTQLTDVNLADLRDRWSTVDRPSLARALRMPTGAAWPSDLSRRLQFIDALAAGINQVT